MRADRQYPFRKKILIMEPALQRRIQRYGWDKAATWYETSWHRQLLPAQQRLLDLAGLRPGESVIDIACGTGLVTLAAARTTGGMVTGVDISDKMIELARIAARNMQIDNVRFERADAEQLPGADEVYDAALCALGLMYFPDPGQSLAECHRVLKKGGRVVVAVWGRRAHCGWSDIFDIVDRRVHSEVCPLFFRLGDTEILHHSLTAAGFKNIRIDVLDSPLEYASAEEACIASFAGGPVALAYHKFSQDVKEEAHAEYLASIRDFRQGDGYLVPGEFVVASGVKA